MTTARASSGPFSELVRLADERAVDLEDVDGEAVQVGQRRVAGAEVVDREAHAERLEAVEALEVGVGVVHDRALGELDHEVAGLEPRLLQRLGHVLHQVAVLQVPRRDVHREAQPAAAGHRAAPAAQVAAGLAQYPAAELVDLAALLDHLDEARGHQHAGLRVAPAHQRLDAEQAAGAEIDDRLILEEELLVRQRAADVGLEPQPLVQHVLHLRLEGDVAVLAGCLGVVHGDIGVAEQRLGARVRRGEGDADAGADAHLGAVELERPVEGLDQGARQALDLADGGDALEQHRELIAAEARHGVGGARGLDDALRHRLQQAVAGVVAERVVDVLEVVQIEEHDRDRALAALRERQCVLHAVAEQVAVGEQRQRIVEGQLAQLLLERLALADVAEVERQALHRRVLAEVAADALDDVSACCRARCAAPPARPCRMGWRRPRRGTSAAARASSPPHSSGRFLPAMSSGLRPRVRSEAGEAKRSTPSAATIMMTSEALAISEA